MSERIEVGDLVRFAHMKEPAGRVTKAVRDSSFHGSQRVEIEGWVGEFGTSGLIVVEKGNMKTEELIGPDNFMQIFTRALERLTLRSDDRLPSNEFTANEHYMLGVASCLGLVCVDNTVNGHASWMCLTPLGRRWLNKPVPLDQLKARASLMQDIEGGR